MSRWCQLYPKMIPTWSQSDPKLIRKFSKDPSPFLLIDRSRCADKFGVGISLWDVLYVEFEPALSFISSFENSDYVCKRLSGYNCNDRSRCADKFAPGISLWDVLCVEFKHVLSFISNFWKQWLCLSKALSIQLNR